MTHSKLYYPMQFETLKINQNSNSFNFTKYCLEKKQKTYQRVKTTVEAFQEKYEIFL